MTVQKQKLIVEANRATGKLLAIGTHVKQDVLGRSKL